MEEYEKKYERRDLQRSLAQAERARLQERILAEQSGRPLSREQDRFEREQRERQMTEQEEFLRREQVRFERDREESIRREQVRFERDRELMKREQELAEELYRKAHMDQDSERRKLSRKEKRTNSWKATSESRSSRIERNASFGLSAPTPEEPKSFLSRWSGFLASAPASTTEASPSKTEVAPKIEAAPKTEPTSKTDRSEPQTKSKQSTLVDLEGYFLQPAQDSLIQKSVVALSDSIDQHVFNHYGDRATVSPPDTFLRIVQIDTQNACLPQALVNQGSFRLAAVRRMIASVLIRSISLRGDPNTTFLPKEIVSLLAMTPAYGTERFHFAASSVLRRTAANLLRLGQNTESPEYTEFKRQQVKVASDRLHRQLSALANLDSSELARREQLEAIMTKGAQIGVLLMLQPATYEFDWTARFSVRSTTDDQGRGSTRPGPFMIFPALSKTGDSTGREMRKAYAVCKPEYLDEDDLADNSIV
ncbi:MAG: hypothetical protein Q9216_006075 [Gyalolechia sp. 2 TL-2023]